MARAKSGRRSSREIDKVATEEWEQIRMQSESEVLERGQKWLSKYGKRAIAGGVIAHLLLLGSSRRLVNQGKRWLRKFPDHISATGVLNGLLITEASPDLLNLAKIRLQNAEDEYFKTVKPDKYFDCEIGALMKEMLTHHSKSKLCNIIEGYITKYPKDPIWRFVFPICTFDQPNRRAGKLTARWLDLNANNQDYWFCPIAVLTPCAEVTETSFNWLRKGGRESPYMPLMLHDVLYSVRKHPEQRPKIVSFTRRWLKANQNHKEAGNLYGMLLLASQAENDIQAAKVWYQSHITNYSARLVISDLLTLAHWSFKPPDPYAVKRAKTLLRNKETSFPRLVGSLVSVWPDEEAIAWAKETVKKKNLWWILINMLGAAPDAESIAMAHDSFDKWTNSSIEHEMLEVLLKVEPSNKRIRRRAYYWLKQHPKHGYWRRVKKLLQKSGTRGHK